MKAENLVRQGVERSIDEGYLSEVGVNKSRGQARKLLAAFNVIGDSLTSLDLERLTGVSANTCRRELAAMKRNQLIKRVPFKLIRLVEPNKLRRLDGYRVTETGRLVFDLIKNCRGEK